MRRTHCSNKKTLGFLRNRVFFVELQKINCYNTFHKNIFMYIMKKNIFIFRHGQTDKNLAQKWQGSGCDDVLNETGKKQAEALSEKVKNLGLEKLYCSSLTRARQTAEYIAKNHNDLLIEVMPDLREVYFGTAEGLTSDEVRKIYGEEFEHQLLNPDQNTWYWHFPEGECKHDVFLRVDACLRQIVAKAENVVGVVCHAGVISALQCGYQLENVSFENCAVLHLQYDCENGSFIKVD